MCNINLEVFAIAKSKSFAILGNGQEPLYSYSDFHPGEQNSFMSTGQLSCLCKRDDGAASLQSIGKKTSKELALPQEKTVFFKAAGIVSLQLTFSLQCSFQVQGEWPSPKSFRAAVGSPDCSHCPTAPPATAHRVWLPSSAAVKACWLHPKERAFPELGPACCPAVELGWLRNNK